MTTATDNLTRILKPVVLGMGYEWVGLEYLSGGHGASLLRIYIDLPEGITLDDCSAVSHQLSGVLDVEDPIRENYHLEISSPGLDRPLFTREQYLRFVGHQVVLKFHGKWMERRKLSGELVDCGEAQVSLNSEGQLFEVPLEVVRSARLVPEF
jgi:ribosome maturation factor RimP